MIQPFKYKKTSKRPTPKGNFTIPAVKETETYTGEIDGMKATQGEENVLRGAYKTGLLLSHGFRVPIGAPRNKPGWKELDFLLSTKAGQYVAVQVRDSDFVHHGEAAEASDIFNDRYIIQQLKNEGVNLKDGKIFTVDDNDVTTVEDAKRLMERILL